MSVELLISLNALAIGANTIWIVALMRRYLKLSGRVKAIESVVYLREWLQAVEDGESPSDMAYMKQKGFLK